MPRKLRPIIRPNRVVSILPRDGDRSKAWFVAAERKRPPGGTKAVISLFTGCGGMEIGLEAAGFRTAACVEIDGDCRETLNANRPSWPLAEPGDITELSVDELLRLAKLRPGEAGLVTGGAPCQPFSTMGKGEGTGSDKGNLFRHFIRVVRGAMPAGFVFENVRGIMKHGEVLETIRSASEDLGYRVSAHILNAADYGVPQRRSRLIVLGLRDWCGAPVPAFPWPTHDADPDAFVQGYAKAGFAAPRPEPWLTVRQCFGDIRPEELAAGMQMGVSDLTRRRIEHIRPGTRDNFKALPDDLKPDCWKSGKHQGHDTFGRLDPDRPSVTIRTCGYHPMKGRYLHPDEDRGLNTVELARLQGFPPEWAFHGGLTSVGKQIGNAVPPPLAEAIGRAMAFQIGRGRAALMRS